MNLKSFFILALAVWASKAHTRRGAKHSKNSRQLSMTSYNLLNLPSSAATADQTTNYYYTSNGVKVQKDVIGNIMITPTIYAGNLIYGVVNPKMLLIEGGYIDLTGDTPAYRFFVTDYQGNIRAVTDGTGMVLRTNHYDPYGEEVLPVLAAGGTLPASTAGTDAASRYMYGAKEWDTDLSLYDFSARWYNPAGAVSFTTMDPLCEKYYSVSPYAYCAGNPVNLVDPSGAIWLTPKKADYLRKMTEERISLINSQIESYHNQLKNDATSQEDIQSIQILLESGQKELALLNESLSDIDRLSKDDHYFALTEIFSEGHHVKQGKGGIISIETSSDAISLHEIRHVVQALDNGGLSFSRETGYLLNPGINEKQTNKRFSMIAQFEVDAYQHQFAMDHSFPISTVQSIHEIDVHTVGAIRNGQGYYVYPQIHRYSEYLRLIESIKNNEL